MRRASALAIALLLATASASAAQDPGADVCLEIGSGAVTDAEWAALVGPVTDAIRSHAALFPAPTVSERGTRIDIDADTRIEPDAGHAAELSDGNASCLEAGRAWTARFGREFLETGADRMLAEAPTTPGIDSSVDLEWYPAETRLRTTLVFSGPLDIPNGTCWVDDALTVEDGVVLASGEHGVKTSLFAESACGRFFDHLPDGGAGEQAVTLLPSTIDVGDAGVLRFVAESVEVREDGVVVAGSLARD
jgi:hypothetical protein